MINHNITYCFETYLVNKFLDSLECGCRTLWTISRPCCTDRSGWGLGPGRVEGGPALRERDFAVAGRGEPSRRYCQVNFSRAEKPKAACAITLRLLHSAIRSPPRLEKSATLIARQDDVVG